MDFNNGNFGGAPSPRPSSGLAIGALATGIAGIVLCWVPVLPVILGIVAVVLGVMAQKQGQGAMATAGLVLGIVALVLGGILSLCYGCVGCGACAAANQIRYW